MSKYVKPEVEEGQKHQLVLTPTCTGADRKSEEGPSWSHEMG